MEDRHRARFIKIISTAANQASSINCPDKAYQEGLEIMINYLQELLNNEKSVLDTRPK